MDKYLLDTDISVFYLRGKYNINQRLKEIIGYDNCFISEITLAELKYGAELSERVEENLHSINEFANKIGILPIFNSLDLYAKEKARLKKSGNLIDDFDLLIACSSIKNNLILVTNNENHFKRIENIKIENWVK
ncbi:MAG: type II toxin-antitoxin system VapC family toxin [Treponema sp.]|jgi:tRNA(fMet)-specific endonuclease VapC|nr:type II toxin-antitoxin system VapC family toxin [Treponema sp.]